MEDLLILGGFASLILFIGIYMIVSIVQSCRAKRKAREKVNDEIMTRGKAIRNEARERLLKTASVNSAPLRSTTPVKPETKSYTYAEQNKGDDGFMDGMMTTVMLNSIMNSKHDTNSGTVTRDSSNEVQSKVDDGPSYRDSSPSSSWSSSSSSDSYSSSSSSDSYSSSSPSSDW